MGLRITTNIPAQAVQKNLRQTTQVMDAELSRLSSGKRINRAADDAAGLAIATNLDAQTRGLRQATRNANDGISLIQTAEGGLNEVSNILIRLRELSVQSASDTVGDLERGLLQKEFDQLTKEVDRISEATTFNGAKLISSSAAKDTLDFHVGAFGGEANKIQFEAGRTDASANAIGISGQTVDSKESANETIGNVDGAINRVSGLRASLGALQSRLQSSVANLEVQTLNQDTARSTIIDTDVAHSAASLASAQVVKQAGIATLAQANNIPLGALRLIN